MARARNIKPGFFVNEDLVELDYGVRLLFIGLWTIADREGRLEDRPKKIKMSLFPADNMEINDWLQQLHDAGFILRYEAGEGKYIQILSFKKHQNPHLKEADSVIPAPYKHGASTVQAPDKHHTSPADSLNPITDSLLPITDSSGEPPGSEEATPDCPHKEVVALYHELLPDMPEVKSWTDKRKKCLRARCREDAKRYNPEWWRKFFSYVAKSDFLNGRVLPRPGEKQFVANLEWILRPNNFAKVLEGNYH